jgi:hypothetical protein
MAMIAMTTSNSIKVNPLWVGCVNPLGLFMTGLPFTGTLNVLGNTPKVKCPAFESPLIL